METTAMTRSVGADGRLLLTIDGGGIRGIIPATLLVALERVTGRLTRETFSFVAGTSTGAIITAGIVAGIPAERILDLYVTRARGVFTRGLLNLPKRIVLGSMYSTERLRDVVADALGSAHDWRLNDSPIDLLITAKRLTDGMPWYFVRDDPANARRTGHLRLVDCAVASAAAPTYFAPYVIPRVGRLVDGGIGVAGNPVYQACVEAFFYTQRYHPKGTTIVSLGTGRFPARGTPRWLWPWLEWVIGELLRSPGEQQTELVRRHFPEATFYRIDPVLDRAVALDGVEQIDLLRAYGERLVARVDWHAILRGDEAAGCGGEGNTLWPQYAQRPA
jgi:hypothetical protein